MRILNDFSTSVRKALEEIEPDYNDLRGLVVCGTHNQENVEQIIGEIKRARENGTPTLLICAGHQLGAIEYARNVMGIKDATSEELCTHKEELEWVKKQAKEAGITQEETNRCMCGTWVVRKRPELKVGLHDGETWWSNYDVAIDWEIPEHFISVPFHPEYQSSKEKPHKLLVDFINLCKTK